MKGSHALTAAALILSVGGVGSAANAPSLKEGLWLVHTESMNQPGGKKTVITSSLCRSHAYDRYVRRLAKKLTENMSGCTTVKDRTEGSTYSVQTHCEVAGTVIDSESTTTYRPDSTHSESRQTYTPPLNGVSETSVVEDQKYLGTCPIGSQPGDLTRADGTELHLWKQH